MSFVPNTTPTPNWLYNGEMKKMNESELKVVLLVTRRTLGWFDPMSRGRKTQDYISQNQFMDFTGQSNRAIATAIQSCVEHGWIIAKDKNGTLCETSEKRRRRKVWYQLGSIFTDKISSEESSLDESLSSEQNDINLVKKVHNTKERRNKDSIRILAKSGDFAKEISSIIGLFKGINPNWTELYKNKTQRDALGWLIGKHGFKDIVRLIRSLPKFIYEKYAPVITTPLQLKNKLAEYVAFVRKSEKKPSLAVYKSNDPGKYDKFS